MTDRKLILVLVSALALGLGIFAFLWLDQSESEPSLAAGSDSDSEVPSETSREASSTRLSQQRPSAADRCEGLAVADREGPSPSLGSLGGRIETADGVPIAKARLQIFRSGSSRIVREVIGDEAGRFSIPGLPKGRAMKLLANADPSLVGRLHSVYVGDLNLRVILQPALSIVGTARNEARQPVAGATVAAQVFFSDRGELEVAETTTDDAGRYRIQLAVSAEVLGKGRSDGPRFLIGSAPGYAETRVSVGREFDRESNSLRRDLQLVVGQTLEGRVVREQGGDPQPDAVVELWQHLGREVLNVREGVNAGKTLPSPLGPRQIATTRTAADGRFRFAGIDTRRPQWLGKSESFGTLIARKAGFAAAGTALPFGESKLEPFELRLQEGVEASGRVLLPNGDPARSAQVRLILPGVAPLFVQPNGSFDVATHTLAAFEPGEGRGNLKAITDDEGRFQFSDFPFAPTASGGMSIQVFAEPFGADRLRASTLGVDHEVKTAGQLNLGDLSLSFETKEFGSRIVCRDESGEAIEGVAMQVHGNQVGRSDAQGEIVWIHGRHPELKGPPESQAVFSRRGFIVEFRDFGPQPLEDLTIVTMTRGRSLRGTVTWADGQPAARALVGFRSESKRLSRSLESSDLGQRYANCDEKGRWHLDGLPEDALEVEFRTELAGIRSVESRARLSAWPKSGVLHLVFPEDKPPLAELRVRVRDSLDNEVPANEVRMTLERVLANGLDDPASLALSERLMIPVGRYRARFEKEGAAPILRDFDLRVGGLDLELRLEAPAEVSVTVPGAATMPSLLLLADRDDGQSMRFPITIGKATRLALPAGAWKFRVCDSEFLIRLDRGAVSRRLEVGQATAISVPIGPIAKARIVYGSRDDLESGSWRLAFRGEGLNFEREIQLWRPVRPVEEFVVPALSGAWSVSVDGRAVFDAELEPTPNSTFPITLR